MTIENLNAVVISTGEGFLSGILIGWALKKAIKIFAVIIGLFLAGLAYLQYKQIASINWDRLEKASEGVVGTLVNATKMSDTDGLSTITELVMPNFGIPFTGSVAAGFTIGFMKG